MQRLIIGLLVAAALIAILLSLAGDGLFIYFSSDDMMNLYWGWSIPWDRLLSANAVPFTTVYRPLGSLFYRLQFSAAGFDPFPFRLAVYLLLLFNCYLTCRLGRALSGSEEIGVLSAVFVVFHSRLLQIYSDNAFVYDVLCFTFYLLTFLHYARIRSKGAPIAGWNLAVLYVLFVAALNAKEIALTLPGVLLAYECIYHPPAARSGAEIRRWLRRSALLPVGMLLISIGAYLGKTAPGSSIHDSGQYVPNLTAEQLVLSSRGYLSELLLLQDYEIAAGEALSILLLSALLALLSRSRLQLFCLAWMILAAVPVLFLYRGFSSMYIPLAGFALYLATALMRGRDFLWRKLFPLREPSGRARMALQAGLFVLVASTFVWWNLTDMRKRNSIRDVAQEHEQVRLLKDELLQMHPEWPEGRTALFLHTRHGESYTALFVVRLLYEDPSIDIGIVGANIPDLSYTRGRSYDYIFDYIEGRLVDVGSIPAE